MIFHTTGSLAGVPHPPPLLTIDGLWRDAVFVDGSNLKAQRSNTQLPVNKLHIHYIYYKRAIYFCFKTGSKFESESMLLQHLHWEKILLRLFVINKV